MLLNPTTFLRVGDSASIKLLSDDLLNTRVALLAGTAVVDVQELDNQNRVRIEIAGTGVEILKDGQYHFTTEGGGRLRVYDGEALLGAAKLTKGWEMVIGGTPAKFDRDEKDGLYLWSEQRNKVLNPPVPMRRRIPNSPRVFRL
jgi:hypothetical protein